MKKPVQPIPVTQITKPKDNNSENVNDIESNESDVSNDEDAAELSGILYFVVNSECYINKLIILFCRKSNNKCRW